MELPQTSSLKTHRHLWWSLPIYGSIKTICDILPLGIRQKDGIMHQYSIASREIGFVPITATGTPATCGESLAATIKENERCNRTEWCRTYLIAHALCKDVAINDTLCVIMKCRMATIVDSTKGKRHPNRDMTGLYLLYRRPRRRSPYRSPCWAPLPVVIRPTLP